VGGAELTIVSRNVGDVADEEGGVPGANCVNVLFNVQNLRKVHQNEDQ